LARQLYDSEARVKCEGGFATYCSNVVQSAAHVTALPLWAHSKGEPLHPPLRDTKDQNTKSARLCTALTSPHACFALHGHDRNIHLLSHLDCIQTVSALPTVAAVDMRASSFAMGASGFRNSIVAVFSLQSTTEGIVVANTRRPYRPLSAPLPSSSLE